MSNYEQEDQVMPLVHGAGAPRILAALDKLLLRDDVLLLSSTSVEITGLAAGRARQLTAEGQRREGSSALHKSGKTG
jgi:hypothetical protein